MKLLSFTTLILLLCLSLFWINPNTVVREIAAANPLPTPSKVISLESLPSAHLMASKHLRATQFLSKYKLKRKGRYKLLNGSYNNRYEGKYFNDFVVEVQTLNGRVLGMDVIFYGVDHLSSRELTFIYRFVETVPNSQKLDDATKNAIVKAAETDGMSRSDVAPVVLGKIRIFARRAGPGATVVSIESAENEMSVTK